MLFVPLLVCAQEPLKDDELAARLKEKSFAFPAEGGRSATLEFKGGVVHRHIVNPNGKIINDSGPWRVKGAAFCVTYAQGEQCNQVRVAGSGLEVMRRGQWVEFRQR
ncbi:MAG TPA: hypothetical protein VFK48_19325 [Usitatibacter sp.]|nr:hypothetical protein [Usitatibacter sp.]